MQSSFPDDGRKLRPKHVELTRNNKLTYIVETRKRKANWIGQILRRNCLLQWVIDGKTQGG